MVRLLTDCDICGKVTLSLCSQAIPLPERVLPESWIGQREHKDSVKMCAACHRRYRWCLKTLNSLRVTIGYSVPKYAMHEYSFDSAESAALHAMHYGGRTPSLYKMERRSWNEHDGLHIDG